MDGETPDGAPLSEASAAHAVVSGLLALDGRPRCLQLPHDAHTLAELLALTSSRRLSHLFARLPAAQFSHPSPIHLPSSTVHGPKSPSSFFHMKETALLIDCTASALDLAWADSSVMDRWDASALSADVVNTHAIGVTSLALRSGESESIFYAHPVYSPLATRPRPQPLSLPPALLNANEPLTLTLTLTLLRLRSPDGRAPHISPQMSPQITFSSPMTIPPPPHFPIHPVSPIDSPAAEP